MHNSFHFEFLSANVWFFTLSKALSKSNSSLLQPIVHVSRLRNFIGCFVNCFQYAFQFLNLYWKFMGMILHINVDFRKLFPLLQISSLQL
jgi:hypothetical protein